MYDTEVKGDSENTSPYFKANWLSKISFWWLNSLLWAGYKKQLTQSDLYDTLPDDESSLLTEKLERCWKKEEQKKSPSLFRAVLWAFRWECFTPGFFLVFIESVAVVRPYIIGNLIGYFDLNSEMPLEEGILYAVTLGFCSLTQLLFLPLYSFKMLKVVMQMKAAVSGLIFRKVLEINSQSLHQATSGQVINLLSTDVEKFSFNLSVIHFIWLAPLQFLVIMYLSYRYVGIAALFALVLVAFLLLLQFYFARVFGRLRMVVGRLSDLRVQRMNEILAGMRVVKMYCWEKPFSDLVAKLRKSEVKYIRYGALVKSINIGLYHSGTKIMLLVIFIAAWQLQHRLSSQLIFSVIGWIELLKKSVFLFWSLSIENNTQLASSLQRIQRFLTMANFHRKEDPTCRTRTMPINVAVKISSMSAVWGNTTAINSDHSQDSTEMTLVNATNTFGLEDITLEFKKGQLIAVVGPVGAGKSSLLLTLLGELNPCNGSISVNGTLGYVSQQAWVISATVKQNILFGEPYDADLYSQIIHVCALKKDIDVMPHGDETLVGERGLRMSGGQKARIILARCLYRKADIYLLDDPLSAVDAGVGRHIFYECICRHLEGSTRILVTHQMQYLKEADTVVILKEGRVVDIGSYEELISRGTEFFKLVSKEKTEEEGIDTTEMESSSNYGDIIKTDVAEEKEEEDMAGGHVGWGVYKKYISASHGAVSVPVLFVVAIAAVSSLVSSDWFLAKWAHDQDLLGNLDFGNTTETADMYFSDDVCYNCTTDNPATQIVPVERAPKSLESSGNMIYMYIVLACCYFVAIFIHAILHNLFSVIAGQRLHNKMFRIVLQARCIFFDTNPVGRILNRFSRDIGFIDDVVPMMTQSCFMLAVIIAGMLVMTCMINPWVLVPLAPLCVIVVLLRFYAVRTTRYMKRIEAIARSPLYSHLSETLVGLETIRSLRMERRFIREFDKLQNEHTTAWFHYIATHRWFSLRSSFIAVIYLNFCLFLSFFLRNSLGLDSGLVGLLLTYCFALTEPVEFWVRMTAELETAMTSVERVVSYTKLQQEADRSSPNPPPPNWPQHGNIVLKNVCLKYSATTPEVLMNFNCDIRAKEKIGIVGRTGAGKSSITSCLLRLYEPTGSIYIDGVNVLEIGLHELRSKISIIPQVCFYFYLNAMKFS
ncbi:hypothetical protein ScPMuIL_018268 [Solemya velum]